MLWESEKMAYQGYLLKVGNYTIPHKMIRAETYQVTKSTLDLDSYRDANGLLHRQALDHSVAKVEFEVPTRKTDKEITPFLQNIQRNYTNAKEKKAMVTLYIPETDSYITQEMYVPDITFTIFTATETEVTYNAVRVAFIGY